MPGDRRTWFTEIAPGDNDAGEVEIIVGSALDIPELREYRDRLLGSLRELLRKKQIL